MKPVFKIYNTLIREKEDFKPINPPFVGIYVCGPTVYGPPHLGHARAGITFDVLFRFLKNDVIGPGYKVRYVRNITDVGHLQDEVAGAGDDKILRQAKLEKIEPMEVVQKYMISYRNAYAALNNLPPSIEPTASGHIIEQIEITQRILDAGLAYESDGNIYFDIEAYNKQGNLYGKLSGRVLEELMAGERELDGQEMKRNKYDFALWKKASPEHIMKWPSPWGLGFPGWHIECSAMSTKYLGKQFDIHGGGMDLLFPHHECEIAQSVAAEGVEAVRYWVHNNMITLDGQKMAKSLGNTISFEQFLTGDHPLLERAYSPMNIRFFMLQGHYRSTLDFSNTALQASEKGMQRLWNTYDILQSLHFTPNAADINPDEIAELNNILDEAISQMYDDMNTAQVIARLFDLSKKINSYQEKLIPLSSLDEASFARLKTIFNAFVDDILAFNVRETAPDNVTDGLMDLILTIRREAREKKDFSTSDLIRNKLNEIGITVNDGKEGSKWTKN